jgi:hypothetical protein
MCCIYGYCFIVFLLACIPRALYAPESHSVPNITITVNPNLINKNYNNPIQSPSNTITADISSSSKQVLLTNLKFKIPHVPFDYYKDKVQHQCMSLSQWIGVNKQRIVVSIIIGLYALLCYLAHNANQYIKSDTHWFAWKRNSSLSNLLNENQQDLQEQLMVSIQARYLQPSNPTNFIDPIIHFIGDINHELTTLRRYHSLISLLNDFYISRIMLVKSDLAMAIQEKIDRVVYIKKVFDCWIGQHNMQQLYIKKESSFLNSMRTLIIDQLLAISIKSKGIIKTLLN